MQARLYGIAECGCGLTTDGKASPCSEHRKTDEAIIIAVENRRNISLARSARAIVEFEENL